MPFAPARACPVPRCPHRIPRGGVCPVHPPDAGRTRRSSRARGYDALWDRLARAAIAAEPWCHANPCRFPETAGTRINPLQADHPVPLAAGGHPHQLPVVLCRRDNARKGGRLQ
jgi:hypothetical protein